MKRRKRRGLRRHHPRSKRQLEGSVFFFFFFKMVWILDGCWSSNSSGYFGLLPACREQGPSSENNVFLQRHKSRWCCLKLGLLKKLPCSFPHALKSHFIFLFFYSFFFFFMFSLCHHQVSSRLPAMRCSARQITRQRILKRLSQAGGSGMGTEVRLPSEAVH